MNYEPFFPLSSNLSYVAGVFLALLLAFDLLLVRLFPLKSNQWKQVDYICLGLTALSLCGLASEVRRLVADNQVAGQQSIQTAAYDDLRHEAEFAAGPAVCRHFEITESSPSDIETIQREFDRVCEYTRNFLAVLPADPPSPTRLPGIEGRPQANDVVLQFVLSGLDRELESYAAAHRALIHTESATTRTELELTLMILTPLLLAVAFALSITKVTGELYIARHTKPDS